MSNLFATVQIYFLMALIALITLGGASVAVFAKGGGSSQEYFLMLALLMFGILAPLISLLHRPKFRLAAITLSTIFLTLLALIVLIVYEWIDSSNRFWSTFELLLCTGIPGGVVLLFRTKPWGAVFAWSAAIVCAVSSFVGLISIWLMDNSESQSRVLSMSFAFLIYGVAGCTLLINVGRGDRRYFRWPGAAASLAAIVFTLTAIWKQEDWSHANQTAGRICGLCGFTLALVNLILMTRRKGLVRIFKWIAIASACITGLTAVLLTLFNYYDSYAPQGLFGPLFGPPNIVEEWRTWIYRGLDASLLLTIGSILCMIAARELLRLTPLSTSPEGISQLQLTCPFCNETQSMPLSGGCRKCLLQFRITLLEPHCQNCNHLLLNQTTDRCSECGHPIKRPQPPTTPLSGIGTLNVPAANS